MKVEVVTSNWFGGFGPGSVGESEESESERISRPSPVSSGFVGDPPSPLKSDMQLLTFPRKGRARQSRNSDGSRLAYRVQSLSPCCINNFWAR